MKAFIINTQTMQWPIYQGDFELMYPGIDSDTPAPPYAWVYSSPLQEHNTFSQTATETTPALVDGIWYQQWEVSNLSVDEVFSRFNYIIPETLDQFAKTRGYENIVTLTSYASSPNPKFDAEGRYGIQIRSDMWTKLYEIQAEVESGMRPMPSSAIEVMQELPTPQWPT